MTAARAHAPEAGEPATPWAEPFDLPDAALALAPALALRAREWPRTTAELTATLLSGDLVDRWPHGDGDPVLVLPGFLGGEFSTRYLRSFLHRLGYVAYDWELGRNVGLREGMDESLGRTLTRIADEHGRPASIIGWSAGGIFAREVARRNPEHTRMVITLGSPFRGNHKATHAWRLYSLINRGPALEEAMSQASRLAREQPLPVPTTCVYSRIDGIVAWECCTSLPAPRTENVEVRSSHLGYGHNLETLFVIADRLALPEGRWRPMRSGAPSQR